MPLFTAQTTLEGDDAAFALAEALERMQPPALTAECYDIEGMAGLVQVSATFALPPNEVMLAVLAEAFGAAAFEVSSLSQTTWSALTTLPGEGPARALAAAKATVGEREATIAREERTIELLKRAAAQGGTNPREMSDAESAVAVARAQAEQ